MGALVILLRFLVLVLFAMVAGSVFGIWRGYDPTTYTAATFVEMHQGAVRGLNALLPGLAFASIACTLALTWFARGKGTVLWLYVAALLLMVGAGVVTRFVNQPINAQVVNWVVGSLPSDWEELRAAWWDWHVVRTGFSVFAYALLVAAILQDRDSLH